MFANLRLRRNNRPDRRSLLGFTLVELLVVVVIIAVLAAIAVPVFLNQKKKAEEAAAQANISALADLLAVSQSTGGTVMVTEGEIVGTDGAGGVTRMIIPPEMNVRIQVGTAKGTGVAGIDFTAGTWCVSLTNPAGGVISMQQGETKPNMAGNACYAGPSLSTSPENGGSGAVAGPPTSVVATAGDADATITWDAPSFNGGNVISNYVVTSIPDGRTCSSVTLTCAVTGLTNNTAYTFTVKANNSMGASAASNPSNSVTPLLTLSLPGAPTTVIVDAADRNALVSWTAPADNGNATISAYTVTSSPAGKTCTTTGAVSCTVSTLTNGTAYTFTVTATNSVGTGTASAASDPATPSAAPGAPLNVTGVSGTGQVTVSWDIPADDGATPITGYTVTSNPGSRTCTTTGALTCPVTGLTNGTAYTFTVTATNSRGTGPASAPSASVSTNTTPSAPTGVTGTAGNTQVTLSWTAPATGGSAITGYTVTRTPGGNTYTTTGATSKVITGLTNGTAYTFTVYATNSIGDGPASASSSAVTPVTVPGNPTSVTATAGNTQAVVSWTAPGSNGGATITGYTVTSTPGSLTCTTTGGTSCTVNGLTNGTGYTFSVIAANTAGSSSPSAFSTSVTPQIPWNSATGGTVTTYSNAGQTWKVHTFYAGSSTLTITSGLRPFNYLVVGGGGASGNGEGGGGTGGGGGAGGVLTGSATIGAGSVAVTVGAGGGTPSADGGGSSLAGVASVSGGGGGGDWWSSGRVGGSGGGGGGQHGSNGGAGTGGQGYWGGPGDSGAGGGKGGNGGGAGGPGGDAWQASGGAPITSSITGSSLTYAAGGASGTSARGGRGDGGSNGTTSAAPGGSGVIIVAYQIG